MNSLYLIHGTHGHGKDFDGILNYIRFKMGDNWWVESHDWSPAYLTAAARRRGGKSLAEKIEYAHQMGRCKKLALVGFSHGGNVAFLSCRYLPKHQWPDFIGTIGTPMMGFYDKDYDRVSPGKRHFWGAWVSNGDGVQWIGSVGRLGMGRRLDDKCDYIKVYDGYRHTQLPGQRLVWDDICLKIKEVCK